MAKPSRPSAASSLDDLGALTLFAQVVEARSFTAAARRQGTSTSAVSKRIAGLERRLGVRLLERTTRSAAPTEVGLILYERCQRLIAEAASAEEAVAAFRGGMVGTLRVSAAVTFGQLHIAPLVVRFMQAHPGLRVSVALTERKVDLIAEGIDLAVRSGRAVDSSLVSRKLAPDRRVICASPGYFARYGRPRAPNDLLQHRCVRHPLMGPPHGWALRTPQGPTIVPICAELEIDNIAALRDAALSDMGIVLLPMYAVVEELRVGRLERVLDEFVPAEPPFRALWAAGKHPPARTLALAEYLARELPARL